jgi:hypothetical protein
MQNGNRQELQYTFKNHCPDVILFPNVLKFPEMPLTYRMMTMLGHVL